MDGSKRTRCGNFNRSFKRRSIWPIC